MVGVVGEYSAVTENARALDRTSVVPLYHQLFIDLRRRLLEGEWQPGAPFPKDAEIEVAYDVSRITVRQAMAQLVDGNFVVRYRGRGSFVGNLPRQGSLTNHRLVASEIGELGKTPSQRILGPVERFEVSDMTARQMQEAPGAVVAILKRVHYAEGETFCLETVMLSEGKYPGVFERVVTGEETLGQAYDRLGIEVVKCDQSVTATVLSDERRRLLALPDGVPALTVERVGYTLNNEAVDMRRMYYRSDIFSLRQEIIFGEADNRIV